MLKGLIFCKIVILTKNKKVNLKTVVLYVKIFVKRVLTRGMLTKKKGTLKMGKSKFIKENSDSNVLKPSKVKLSKRIWRHRQMYLMMLPAFVYVLIFCYGPMYGLQIAFKDYRMSLGVMDSPWVGFKHFQNFFKSYSFWTLIKNTFALSIYSIVVGFPIPIIVALIINELKGKYKKTVQTVLYAPHFISLVVLVAMMMNMFSPSSGVINHLLKSIGLEPIYFFGKPEYFRHLYVWSGIWKGMGWSAIVYLAALAGVDPCLHEAASIDGATRLQRILKINIPCIMPTIIIMLILRMGDIASIGHEKVFLMQTPLNLETSEVISTFVYKRGIVNSNYSFSAAVGLFNNIINVTMVLLANKISKKYSESSLF